MILDVEGITHHTGILDDLVMEKGNSTRIIRLSDYLQVSRHPEKDHMFLILPKNQDHPSGILASHLVDTEEMHLQLNVNEGVPQS